MSDSQTKNCSFFNEPIIINVIRCKHYGSKLSDSFLSSGCLSGVQKESQVLGVSYKISEEISRTGTVTVL